MSRAHGSHPPVVRRRSCYAPPLMSLVPSIYQNAFKGCKDDSLAFHAPLASNLSAKPRAIWSAEGRSGGTAKGKVIALIHTADLRRARHVR
jgi:hypothetical protein